MFFCNEENIYNEINQLISEKRFPLVIELLNIFQACKPSNIKFCFYRGIVEYYQGNYPAAEKSFRKLIIFDPGNINAYFYLGLVLESQNRNPEAQEAYQRINEILPKVEVAV